MTIARGLYEDLEIIPVDAHNTESAVSLLHRFFQEEGFSGDRSIIAANLEWMRRDDNHWAAIALNKGHFVGIVTVTSMLYVEGGRVGEIGDLYILPEERGNGVARRLVQAAIDWCRARGCSVVAVTITPLGEAAHGLSNFYSRLGFAATGRTISLLRLD